ncbi:hypothetical protein ACIBSW_15565 [Actinoplanes sp. NPDC049668]|uniref:hypothetical protein n=1 Tax=unclassified Actinoplanes TaxID=2626549 RepID=UPI0033A3B9F0
MSTEVEERVRRALAGRAAQITPERLRPEPPPTATAARPSWRPWWRPLLAVAAVLVAAFFAVRGEHDAPPRPVPQQPAATVPSPSLPAPEPTSSPAPSPAGVPVPASAPAALPSGAVSGPPGPIEVPGRPMASPPVAR